MCVYVCIHVWVNAPVLTASLACRSVEPEVILPGDVI